MSTIEQFISNLVQQINARFPGLPPSLLLFFAILAGFIALALVLVVLRLFWAALASILGIKRRRGPLARPVPARLYSTDWALERERRRRDFMRRTKQSKARPRRE